MTEITRLTQLLAAVRTAANRQSSASQRRTRPATPDTPSLMARLSADLKAVQLDTDERRSIARRNFLQTVLIHELGDSLADDPAFAMVSQQVDAAFSGDPQLRADLDTLLRQLQDGAN